MRIRTVLRPELVNSAQVSELRQPDLRLFGRSDSLGCEAVPNTSYELDADLSGSEVKRRWLTLIGLGPGKNSRLE
ncbi:unnamed protein product [Protopolystoma xenopodis]|uniref:Uncharacterized protein n=1 Tax=Protopolystoma xenopodis TaxID=117903 RepID=A0A3S5BPK2_9PLAT|nr:unnamed protein product [Protopolystoma xenopodis]